MTTIQDLLGFGESRRLPSHTHERPSLTAQEAWSALCHKVKTLFSSVQTPVTEYDEPLFRALLELEQRRSRQSGRAVHMLLCTVSSHDGTPVTMSDAVTALLTSHVKNALRKTDHVGWFLKNRTLGVLLTCIEPGAAAISSRRAMDRIRRTLTEKLSLYDPSLVLQLYDDLQLPSPEEQHPAHMTTQALIQEN